MAQKGEFHKNSITSQLSTPIHSFPSLTLSLLSWALYSSHHVTHPAHYNQYISCRKLDLLFRSHAFQDMERDGVPGHRVIDTFMSGRVRDVVEEDSMADNTPTLRPVIYTEVSAFQGVVMVVAVIIKSTSVCQSDL
jgi:hypothetical protein